MKSLIHLSQTFREHKSAMKQLREDFELKREERMKKEIASSGAEKKDLSTAEGLMSHANELMDRDKQSLERTLRVVADTQEVGRGIVDKLQTNTEQIESMYDKLESIENTLERSRRIITRMARKIATDKCVLPVISHSSPLATSAGTSGVSHQSWCV